MRGGPGRDDFELRDFELLEAWSAGDSQAGDALVRRHYSSVLRFFDLKAGSHAEDLTQKTFLACTTAIANLRERTSFRAFLFGIARNQLLHHIRSQSRAAATFDFDDLRTGDGAATPSRVVAMYEEQRLLLRALQLLAVEAQMVLQMFYWESMSNREIAEALGVPLSTVTTRVSRARQALERAIADIPGLDRHRTLLLEGLDSWVASIAELSLGEPVVRGL
ncbi:RNA polymerase sigma factor [Nannocystis sp. RBIL2]|uniref:RNA polymerase sigma factor n=1 Tax=Nannocystis sp. RBIL2 TaxID=2996788 RepID=UPI0022702DCC|nr:RNA polymerase sigma factor [Nannocystis sp. RBIL2]MCY1069827.1 RNA polymerase sigma factor [Nannocystis sp. RBIL2]